MTISLATSLDWPDEVAKLSHGGALIPKQVAVAKADHRDLRRLDGNFETISAIDDKWAESCHFDSVRGFYASDATALVVV